jgi:hypothetical protein
MASDTALRALVAELAQTTPEDVAAVLAMMDTASATRLRRLLAEYGGIALPEREAGVRRIDTTGLSVWLAARVHGSAAVGTDAYRMTPAASDTLRAIAESMPQRLATARPTRPPLPPSRTAFERLFRSPGKGANA